jgi:hypothetical protein
LQISFLLGENRELTLAAPAHHQRLHNHGVRGRSRAVAVRVRRQSGPTIARPTHQKRLLSLKSRVALKIAIWAELICRCRMGRRASMTNDHYPTILSPDVGIPLSLALNFVAPVVAWLLSRELQRHRWWPHAIACFWEISSLFVFGTLLLPTIPADESPGPGDGLLL